MTQSDITMTADKINNLRRRIADGEEVPEEEIRAALDYYYELRGERISAANTPKASKGKKISQAEAQALLDNLEI